MPDPAPTAPAPPTLDAALVDTATADAAALTQATNREMILLARTVQTLARRDPAPASYHEAYARIRLSYDRFWSGLVQYEDTPEKRQHHLRETGAHALRFYIHLAQDGPVADWMDLTQATLAVGAELTRATARYGMIANLAEGAVVILEEIDEFWAQVRRWPKHNADAVAKELVQIAAMCVRTLADTDVARP